MRHVPASTLLVIVPQSRGLIHRTDGEGEWILRAEGGESTVESGHGKADVAMRGSAESLYRMVLGRGKPDELGIEMYGDPALAGAFKEWFPGP